MAVLWRLADEVLSAPTAAEGATSFVDRLDADRRAGTLLAPVIPPWVLTISYSSSVLDCLQQARLRLVTCMESQPGGEGARMAEAISEWGRALVVPDEEALRTMPGAAVVVGCDAVTPQAVVNKTKTRALAEAARVKGVPCYAVAGSTKFVDRSLPAEPPFEAVPLDLFEAIATPDGPLSAEQARERAEEAALHPELLILLARLRGR